MKDKIIKTIEDTSAYLKHYKTKGAKNGVRRYQNEDGSLTPEGYKHYGITPRVKNFQEDTGKITEESRNSYGKYPGMTDKDLIEAIGKKKLENEYVSLQTRLESKNTNDKRALAREIFNTAGKGVDIGVAAYKSSFKKEENYMHDKADELKKRNDESIKKANEAIKAWNEKGWKEENDRREFLEGINVEEPGSRGRVKGGVKLINKKWMDPNQEDLYKQAKDSENNNRIAQKQIDDVYSSSKNAVNNIANGAIGKTIENNSFNKKLKEEGEIAKEEASELGKENLEAVVKRLRLEKEYEDLVSPPKPSAAERGREIVSWIGSLLGIGLTGIYIVNAIKDGQRKKEKGVKQSAMYDDKNFLIHYRTQGSKNGVRRYQNEDGSLTPEGYAHYGIDPNGRNEGQVEVQGVNPKQYKSIIKLQSKLSRQSLRDDAYRKDNDSERKMSELRDKSSINRLDNYDKFNNKVYSNNAKMQKSKLDSNIKLKELKTRSDLRRSESDDKYKQERNINREAYRNERAAAKDERRYLRDESRYAMKEARNQASIDRAAARQKSQNTRKNIGLIVASAAVLGTLAVAGASKLMKLGNEQHRLNLGTESENRISELKAKGAQLIKGYAARKAADLDFEKGMGKIKEIASAKDWARGEKSASNKWKRDEKSASNKWNRDEESAANKWNRDEKSKVSQHDRDEGDRVSEFKRNQKSLNEQARRNEESRQNAFNRGQTGLDNQYTRNKNKYEYEQLGSQKLEAARQEGRDAVLNEQAAAKSAAAAKREATKQAKAALGLTGNKQPSDDEVAATMDLYAHNYDKPEDLKAAYPNLDNSAILKLFKNIYGK